MAMQNTRAYRIDSAVSIMWDELDLSRSAKLESSQSYLRHSGMSIGQTFRQQETQNSGKYLQSCSQGRLKDRKGVIFVVSRPRFGCLC
jgi:hypothetical protein